MAHFSLHRNYSDLKRQWVHREMYCSALVNVQDVFLSPTRPITVVQIRFKLASFKQEAISFISFVSF